MIDARLAATMAAGHPPPAAAGHSPRPSQNSETKLVLLFFYTQNPLVSKEPVLLLQDGRMA